MGRQQPLNLEHVDTVGGQLEGQILQNQYRVEECIGQGGMAWVYKATHLELGGDVAIKILFSDFSEDPHKKERFLLEARIQNQLAHPHIVRVQNVIQTERLLGYVMEWCNAGHLLGWLKKAQGRLSIEQLQVLFLPIVDAVGFAHSQDVIHRDIKPHNILLHKSGDTIVPKVADFGIARVLRSVRLTAPGEMMGTLEYAAPEQLKDSKNVDHRSDIYSLGVLLYRMTTGRLPFVGSPAVLIKGVTDEAPIPPDEADPALQSLILKCLQKEPARRFQSCAAFREAFLAATSLKDANDSIRSLAPSALGGELTPYSLSGIAASSSEASSLDLSPLLPPQEREEQRARSGADEQGLASKESMSGASRSSKAAAQERKGPASRSALNGDSDTNDFYGAIGALRAEQDARRSRKWLFGSLLGIIMVLLAVIVFLIVR